METLIQGISDHPFRVFNRDQVRRWRPTNVLVAASYNMVIDLFQLELEEC